MLAVHGRKGGSAVLQGRGGGPARPARPHNGPTKVDARFKVELERVLHSVPTELGWQRTNWTRELLSLELAERGLPHVAACTMGRALSAIGARLGMPKPTVLCPWDSARRKRVLAKLRRLARNATEAEPS